MRPPFSFPRKKTGGVTVQKKGVCIVCLPLNSLFACGLHCLPSVVSKRLGLLLSSLSLCLRFGSLTQFPPTLDLYRFAIACRGGFAGARRSTHYRNSMRCRWQVIRLHQNKISRAAADNGSTPNRIAELNAAAPRAGSAIGKRRNSSSCSPAMENLSLGGSKGGYSLS